MPRQDGDPGGHRAARPVDRRQPAPSARRSRRAATRRPPAAARRRPAQRGGQPDGARHVVGPAAPLALLAPAVRARGAPPAGHAQRPGPAGPPTLWALTDTRSAPAVELGQVELGRGLDGVGVHAGLRRAPADQLDTSASGWTTPISLLAVMTATSVGARGDRCGPARRGRPRRAASTGSSRTVRPPEPPRRRAELAHRRVLDRRAQHRRLAGPRSAASATSEHGQVVRLGAPGGEDHLAGVAARGSSATSSRASSTSRRARGRADGPRGVADRSRRGPRHGLAHLGAHRRRRGVIEIGARRPSRSQPPRPSWRCRTP